MLIAAELGDLKLLEKALEEKADVNHPYENGGTTALMESAHEGNEEVFDALVKAGAHLDAQDSEGRTALMHAVLARNETALKKLLEAGADKSLRDNQGKSARDLAAQNYQIHLLELL